MNYKDKLLVKTLTIFSVTAIWLITSVVFIFLLIKDLKNATSYFEILKILIINGVYFSCLREVKKKIKKKLNQVEKELDEYITAIGGK